ncbi:MAG: hypothetical protein KF814_08255 [Nitrospiraceae bacterium]|nr:hypothetical protein [Nitrospiraceae bacterium]
MTQISTAEELVNQVQVTGAARYAPQDLARLQGHGSNLRRELLEQESKFWFLRDYRLTKGLAAQLEADARTVLSQAEQRAVEARAAALQAQSVAHESVKAVQQLAARYPETEHRRLPEYLKQDVSSLKKSLKDIQHALDADDFLAAQASAKAIYDKGKELSEEIHQVTARPTAAIPEKTRRKAGPRARIHR